MVIVVPFTERDQRDPPVIPTRIGGVVGLTAPQVAHGVDAKGRVEDREGPPDSGEEKATDPTHPAVGHQADDKGNRKAGEHNGHIVPRLPHDDRILPQA